MNKTYRSIWNASLGCYVAAPECASSQRAGTSATRSVRCREPMRSGSPLVLESRVLFDGAMVATVIEQDSASDAPVIDMEVDEADEGGETAVVETTDAVEASAAPEASESPEAVAEEAAPEPVAAAVAEEEVAAVSQDTTEASDDTPLATPEPVAAPSVEVVFVDGRVPDVASFEAPGREVIVLSIEEDGMAQIATALDGRTDIDAIHIVSHGGDGYLSLGSGQVTTESIQTVHLQSLQAIGQSLTADGDILIYACDYASGDSGLEAMNLLADITGADVAASVDATGHESLGADWTLEQSSGEIEAQALAPLDWMNALDFTFTGAGVVGALGMANNIMGEGVTVVSATYQGGANQSGTFDAGSGVTLGSNVLGFTSGTILSTGNNAAGVAGPNNNTAFGDDAVGAVDGDATLNAMAGYPTFDAAILNIDFIPDVPPGGSVGDVGRMTLEIVFGSDEYLEYVGSINDVMEVTVNGQVVSLVPNSVGGESTIGINSVNTTENPALFINNEGGAYNTQMDAFTITIPMTFDIIVGQTNTIRLAVADAVDTSLDSWMFVRADSGQTVIVAENDQVSTAANLPISVDLTANDYSLAGGTMSLTHIQGQAVTQGQVITLGSGIELTVGSGGQVTVTGDGSSAANDTFTYQVSNGLGGVASATVNVDITAPNLTPPVAQNDSESVAANATLSDSVLADNGSGADTDPNGDTLSVVQVNLTGFTPGAPIALPSGALLTMNGNGTYVYDPNGAFDGLASGATQDDSFSYTVTDGNGGNATATVTVTVSGTAVVNSAPTAVDDQFTVNEDNFSALGSLLANDSDPDGDDISMTLNSLDGSNGGFIGMDDSGAVVFNPNGEFDDLKVGESRTTAFVYTLTDSQGASSTANLTLTVTGVNDAPVGTNDSYIADEDHATFLGNPLINDLDPEGGGRYLGMNTTVGSAGGLFSTDDSGNVFFSPNGDFDQLAVGESRTTSANYLVYDDEGASSSATMTVTVNGLNDKPTPVNDHHYASEDDFLSLGSPLANDSDPEGDYLALSMTPTRGTNGGMFSVDDSWSVYFYGNGEFDDLVSGQSRDTTFVYSVIDEHGALSSATVTVTVYGANDAPVVANDAYQAYEDNAVVLGSPLVNDSDADGDQLFIELNGASSGGGVFSLNGDNTLSFNPNGDFDDLGVGESRTTSIIYNAFDVHGGATLATASVTVLGLNDNPTAVDDSYTVAADTATLLGNALDNDSDVDGDAIQVDAMLEWAGSAGGLFSIGATGELSFNPNGEFDDLAQGQTRVTTVEYTVRDGQGGASTATATVTVSGVGTGEPVDPTPPVAAGQVANGDEGLPLGDAIVPTTVYANEVVFVDARVSDPDAFAADGREVIILNLEDDGLAQMAAALSGRTGIEALHIISHGADGYFTLGSGEVNAETMQTTQRAWLESIGQSLTLNGDILVYACDFASTSVGLEAMNVLAQLTVADVSASLNTTGHETLGADWSLEARVGTVEADEVTPNNWVYGLSQESLQEGAQAAPEEVAAEGVASVTPPVDTPEAAAPTPDAGVSPVVTVASAPVTAELAQDSPAPAPVEGIADAPEAAPGTEVAVVVEPAAPVINAIRQPDLEAAVWQALETATPAVDPVVVEALMVAGVETTPEWTQSHVGGGAAPADHAFEAPVVVELEELPVAEAAAVDGAATVPQAVIRPHAAQGFRAQLNRWAQWPAQRPLTRAVARG